MATQVQNPFDTQQPKATNTTPTSPTSAGTGAISGGTTQPMVTGLVNQAVNFNPTPDIKPQTYTAQTREVNAPTETVAGQVDSILAKDSPLMQRARTLATQQMNQRGLVNSSMSQGAGVAAMIDRATPIAQQDAKTFSDRSVVNMDATNQQNQFNVGQQNTLFQQGQDIGARFAMQKDAQTYQTGERVAGQEYNTGERVAGQEFTSGENKVRMDFDRRMTELQESGADFRQARDIASRETLAQLEQAGVNNRFDQEMALKSNMFNIEQINADRRAIQQNDFELKKLGIQIDANRQDIPTSFAANISNTAMSGVNAILADPNLKADAKKAAIDNIVNYANSQITWASKFYATEIPLLSAPA
jgi:hypothetical protein